MIDYNKTQSKAFIQLPSNDREFKVFLQSKINSMSKQNIKPQLSQISITDNIAPKECIRIIEPNTIETDPIILTQEQPLEDIPDPFKILWNSTYLTKFNINDYIEENKVLRAKVWNYEKENRKMHRQLDSWGLANEIDSQSKTFVDSCTLQKVFKDNHYQTVTKKQELVQLSEVCKQREDELQKMEEVIDKQKQNKELNADFEKYSIKEFYILLIKAQTVDQVNNLEQQRKQKTISQYSKHSNLSQLRNVEEKLRNLHNQKKELRTQNLHLSEMNSVFSFEVEVQQNMYKKLVRETLQIEKRFQMAIAYTARFEQQLKEKQPQALKDLSKSQMQRQNKKISNQVIGRIEKTTEEVLIEKTKQYDDQKKRIDQLSFQIQELIRTCIMEKQDLQKEIFESKEEQKNYNEKILQLKINIQKYDQFEQSYSTDKSNNRGDSIISKDSI